MPADSGCNKAVFASFAGEAKKLVRGAYKTFILYKCFAPHSALPCLLQSSAIKSVFPRFPLSIVKNFPQVFLKMWKTCCHCQILLLCRCFAPAAIEPPTNPHHKILPSSLAATQARQTCRGRIVSFLFAQTSAPPSAHGILPPSLAGTQPAKLAGGVL